MRSKSKVLIGVLYSGEAEFSKCLDSIAFQENVWTDHLVIKDKPNKEAHDELYARFMSEADKFDFFFKLDADMVFKESNGLTQMVELVSRQKAAHLMSYVFDHPSGLSIPGVQLFRSDSRWEGSSETLNVDYAPRITGKSILAVTPNFVDHMLAPSEYQLFRYGIHKALKANQYDRPSEKRDPRKGLLHTAILNGIARNYCNGRLELVWALIGAMLVQKRTIPPTGYHNEKTQDIFIDMKQNKKQFQSAKSDAEKFFSNEIQSLFRWFLEFSR
jgi:hypothetical protein